MCIAAFISEGGPLIFLLLVWHFACNLWWYFALIHFVIEQTVVAVIRVKSNRCFICTQKTLLQLFWLVAWRSW